MDGSDDSGVNLTGCVELQLTIKQAQFALQVLNLGVSNLGAKIAENGIAAIKSGVEILSEMDAVVDKFNTAITAAQAARQQMQEAMNNGDVPD